MAGEDRGRFTRGGGRYAADLVGADTLAVAFVRSTVARGRIERLDLNAVRRSSGVLAAFDGTELAAQLSPLQLRWGPGKTYDWYPLARDWVSYVGEPLAVVVAGDRAQAEEACERAEVDYEPLPAVVDVVAGREGEPGLVRPEVGTNVLFATAREHGDVAGALAASHAVVQGRFHLARQSACPLENRGVLASEDELTGELVVCTSTQIPHIARDAIAGMLERPSRSVRVVVPDVGGGFGLKAQLSAEECVVAHLASRLGRRLAWIEDRWENLVASFHAHDEWVRLEVGFSSRGAIEVVVAEVVADVGAHSSYPLSAALEPSSTSGHLFGCYRIPAARVESIGVATDKCPTGAYRGVGASVASFAAERLLDKAATELGLSRIEIRRRNLLSRHEMPYDHPIAGRMEAGDPLFVLDELLRRIEHEPWFAALAQSPPTPDTGTAGSAADAPGASGGDDTAGPGCALLGVGISVFDEHSGPGSAVYRRRGVTEVPGYDTARVVFGDDGTFTVFLSSAEAGQQHAAVCRLEVAKQLGVDPRLVEVVEGDTASCPPGTGTFASRFAVAQLSAALRAAERMGERLRRAAASYLGSEPEDVRRAEGGFSSDATSSGVSLAQLADWLYRPPRASEGREQEVPVEEVAQWDGGPVEPCGAMAAVVAIDPETLTSKVERVVLVEECGRVLDRGLATGQLVGGVVMGIGDALLEQHLYDESGEITTSSFLDYLLPSIADAPAIEVVLLEEESLFSTQSSTGSKGLGEAGTIGAVASVGCALADALAPLGGVIDALPATPLALFRSIHSGNRHAGEPAGRTAGSGER